MTQRRRRTVVIAGVLLLAAIGAAITVTGWVQTAAMLGVPAEGLEQLETRLRAHHRGEGPCLRYPEPPPHVVAVAAAQGLVDGGISAQQTSALAVLFLDWSEESEARHHDASKQDELLEATGAGLLKRLVVRPALRRMEENSALPRMRREAEEAWAKTPAAQQATLRAAYAHDPIAFTLPGLIRVLSAMRARVTDQRLDALSAKLLAQTAPPENLSDLGLPTEELRDGWNHTFQYEPGVSLSSFGRDGVAGGDGDDADRIRSLAHAPRGVPAAPSPCKGPPAPATLSARDIDSVVNHADELALQARIVPYFEGGAARGFKLFAIRPDSLYQRVGLCNGDVVSRIDGYDLTSPDKALEIYEHMKGRKRFDLELIRAGTRHHLEVVIR